MLIGPFIFTKTTEGKSIRLLCFNEKFKVEMVLEQREVAYVSPSKICENLNFSTVHPEKFKFSQVLLGHKNATYLCSKIISTLGFKITIKK